MGGSKGWWESYTVAIFANFGNKSKGVKNPLQFQTIILKAFWKSNKVFFSRSASSNRWKDQDWVARAKAACHRKLVAAWIEPSRPPCYAGAGKPGQGRASSPFTIWLISSALRTHSHHNLHQLFPATHNYQSWCKFSKPAPPNHNFGFFTKSPCCRSLICLFNKTSNHLFRGLHLFFDMIPMVEDLFIATNIKPSIYQSMRCFCGTASWDHAFEA